MFQNTKQTLFKPIGIVNLFIRVLMRKRRTSSRIYLLNIPSHGNLGDHLISIAEQKFFSDNFPHKDIVLVTSADLFYSMRISLLDVWKNDILCVTGGGFMGSLYDEEQRFLTLVKRFPNNKIIFLPQTFYYEPTARGGEMIKQAEHIYSQHKNLYMVARESNSFNLLNERLMKIVRDRVFLLPDMALYYHYPQNHKREGVTWCLRNDVEVNRDNKPIIDALKRCLAKYGLPETYADTYVHHSVPLSNEAEEVMSMLNVCSHSQLVITDRLHGMIYSVITDTPVIVLDNLNHKVSQVYNLWLKNIPLVKLVDKHCNNLDNLVNNMLTQRDCYFDNSEIKKMYQPIIDIINE